MIVAVCPIDAGSRDTPTVVVVDPAKCSADWQRAIEIELEPYDSERVTTGEQDYPRPEDLEGLEQATVSLPALIEAVVTIYYGE